MNRIFNQKVDSKPELDFWSNMFFEKIIDCFFNCNFAYSLNRILCTYQLKSRTLIVSFLVWIFLYLLESYQTSEQNVRYSCLNFLFSKKKTGLLSVGINLLQFPNMFMCFPPSPFYTSPRARHNSEYQKRYLAKCRARAICCEIIFFVLHFYVFCRILYIPWKT